MASIKPFCGIRPTQEKASAVAALPYDVMNSEEARQMVVGKPDSFLHVDKAEIDLDPAISPYDDRVYQKAKENLEKMISSHVLLQDEKPMFYIYRLKMGEQVQTGLVACTSIDEYLNETIKKHELTRADKEEDRIRHVDTLNANTGPIFLAYREKEEIRNILKRWMEEHPAIYDFVAEDGVEHSAWKIEDADVISALVAQFQQVPNLYIADGHHRNASAVKVGLKRREQNPNYTGEEEFNYYLAVLFSADDLYIMDYNRLVKDLNGHTPQEFLQKVAEKFEIIPCTDDKSCSPKKLHQFGMYLEGKWYLLCAKEEIISKDAVESLDVSILQKSLLEPILAIGDPRTDQRIDFVGGIRGLKELERRVDNGEMAVAFSMYPTSMEELMAVADSGRTMPPKSTWFEPKLRSGLFIHSLEG
ncbi:MAG: DUF1015 domain-containing protein [Epulopiscium sp.]|jgi:uncharacterized protein (DUF1015 family)|nr:DUF1015 domain-containing protein [Candidatus Epulonipiscium sp.]